ncbi:MAG: hypothetical protein K0S07_1317 [Chlamydiales bacterium]|jgi:hypothetical protein|nr:hypothetical protein [Chlamydiales bacterium]
MNNYHIQSSFSYYPQNRENNNPPQPVPYQSNIDLGRLSQPKGTALESILSQTLIPMPQSGERSTAVKTTPTLKGRATSKMSASSIEGSHKRPISEAALPNSRPLKKREIDETDSEEEAEFEDQALEVEELDERDVVEIDFPASKPAVKKDAPLIVGDEETDLEEEALEVEELDERDVIEMDFPASKPAVRRDAPVIDGDEETDLEEEAPVVVTQPVELKKKTILLSDDKAEQVLQIFRRHKTALLAAIRQEENRLPLPTAQARTVKTVKYVKNVYKFFVGRSSANVTPSIFSKGLCIVCQREQGDGGSPPFHLLEQGTLSSTVSKYLARRTTNSTL